jgi:hypothetical protein
MVFDGCVCALQYEWENVKGSGYGRHLDFVGWGAENKKKKKKKKKPSLSRLKFCRFPCSIQDEYF